MINLPRLVLFPRDAGIQSVAASVIRDHLSESGMTGGVSQQDKSVLLPGPEFMQLVTFLGCSPTVSMVAGDERTANRYFIEVAESDGSVIAICGAPRHAPCCPQCKHSATDRDEPFAVTDTGLTCARCGFRSPLSGWDWRRRAGFGRQWINIWGVHEGEAVPGEKLLNSLKKLTGLAWNYAWCRD